MEFAAIHDAIPFMKIRFAKIGMFRTSGGSWNPKGGAASMRNLYLKQNQTVSLLFKFIKDTHKIDEALLVGALL